MGTYYKYGPFSLFHSYEEADKLRQDRWKKKLEQAPKIEEIHIDGKCLYSATGGIDSWSLWSDNTIRPYGFAKVYRPIDSGLISPKENKGKPLPFLMDRYVQVKSPGITKETARLISLCRGSDSGSPDWLSEIRDAKLICETKSEPKTGGYQGTQIDTWDVTLVNGTKHRWYVLTEGYFEGYCCEFFTCKTLALHWRKRLGWIATECWECGATYSEPGHVEPGCMSCDRCM